MNGFEKALITYIGEENFQKLQTVKIGLAGAGGIGSNCALNLVRSGFKSFKIVDFDKVEFSNLNRQFYFTHQIGQVKVNALKENLLAINPDINVETLAVKITPDNVDEMFSDCNIIVEAFDKVVYKKMLIEAYAASPKLLVAISGIAGWGKSDEIKVNKVNDFLYIVGDLISAIGPGLPPISPRVNVAAAKLADIILSQILDNDSKGVWGFE